MDLGGRGHDLGLVRAHVQEHVEQVLRVAGAGVRLGVELHAEEGLGGVDDALVGLIVGVDKVRRPALRERVHLHHEPVVLRSDENIYATVSARKIV